MVGKGKLTYTALVSNVGIFPVDPDPAETLRMGSERFSAALRRDRAAENAPVYAASWNKRRGACSAAFRVRRTGGAVTRRKMR